MKQGQRLILMALACSLCPHTFGHEPKQALQYKVENSRVIVWDGVSSDPSANQINVSNAQGHTIVRLNVLKPVPEAQSVSICDVSANTNLIAVAAVYKNREGNQTFRPAAALVLFNIHGDLLSAFALDVSHAISRLVLDDESHIWTLTDGAGKGMDPSAVPLVVEYTGQGRVLKEVLHRDMFPFHALDTKEDIVMGRAAMGYSSGVVWLWLPGSTELVTIPTGTSKPSITKTELPRRTGRREAVLGIFREPSGNVVGQFREDDEQLRPTVSPEVAHYVWSPATGLWSRFRPSGCEGARLMGITDKGLAFMQYGVTGFQTDNICTTAMP